jgi:hypothetical protein
MSGAETYYNHTVSLCHKPSSSSNSSSNSIAGSAGSSIVESSGSGSIASSTNANVGGHVKDDLDLMNCTGNGGNGGDSSSGSNGNFTAACKPAPEYSGVYSTDLFVSGEC